MFNVVRHDLSPEFLSRLDTYQRLKCFHQGRLSVKRFTVYEAIKCLQSNHSFNSEYWLLTSNTFDPALNVLPLDGYFHGPLSVFCTLSAASNLPGTSRMSFLSIDESIDGVSLCELYDLYTDKLYVSSLCPMKVASADSYPIADLLDDAKDLVDQLNDKYTKIALVLDSTYLSSAFNAHNNVSLHINMGVCTFAHAAQEFTSPGSYAYVSAAAGSLFAFEVNIF